MRVQIGTESINAAAIESAGIDTRHYMNGSASYLVVRLTSGREIRQEHGWGFDAFETMRKIDAALSAGETTS